MDTLNNQATSSTRPVMDPETFGEDLSYASQRALDLAPIHCNACATYHMFYPIKRHLSTVAGIPDRKQLVAKVGGLLADSARKDGGPIDVVVGGAADSGVLAVCAHAAHLSLGEESSRVRFTVLDRCPTPLALCRDYALRNDIVVDVHAVDLVSTTRIFPADVIVHHSLLSFVESSKHESTLQKFARWLKPRGRIVFSTEVRSPSARDKYKARRSQRAAQIRAGVETGALVVNEPLEVFYARLASVEAQTSPHIFDFESADHVRDLFVRTGLTVLSNDRIVDSSHLADGRGLDRERVIAVLAAPTRK